MVEFPIIGEYRIDCVIFAILPKETAPTMIEV